MRHTLTIFMSALLAAAASLGFFLVTLPIEEAKASQVGVEEWAEDLRKAAEKAVEEAEEAREEAQEEAEEAAQEQTTPAAEAGGVNWCPSSPEQLPLTAKEQEMVKLHNQARSQNGLGELCLDSRLVKAARLHAQNMIEANYFAHDSPDGRDPGGRISAQGYDWGTYGENISYGSGSYSTPQNNFDRWMNSEGHLSNILSSNFTAFSIGEASGDFEGAQDTSMWVADFGASQ